MQLVIADTVMSQGAELTWQPEGSAEQLSQEHLKPEQVQLEHRLEKTTPNSGQHLCEAVFSCSTLISR